jgi:hypothetical protein
MAGLSRVGGAARLLLIVVVAASCAKAQAKSAPVGPPLDVPQPPPRVLGPIEAPPIAVAQPVVEAAPPEAPRAVSRPPARRPEAERVESPQAPAGPTDAQAVPEPPRELRAAPSAREAAAEKAVRDTLARAARDLSRVDAARLSPDVRALYDQSKRFTLQAEQALRDRNIVFAATLADKAAVLAGDVAGR